MNEEQLDFSNFENWLEKNKRKIVGYACSKSDCPINRFMCDEFNLQDIEVGKLIVIIQGRYVGFPRVISRFIAELDSLFYSPVADKQAERVFGSQALKIWKKVSKESI